MQPDKSMVTNSNGRQAYSKQRGDEPIPCATCKQHKKRGRMHAYMHAHALAAEDAGLSAVGGKRRLEGTVVSENGTTKRQVGCLGVTHVHP